MVRIIPGKKQWPRISRKIAFIGWTLGVVAALMLTFELLLRLIGFSAEVDTNDTITDYVAEIPLFIGEEEEEGRVRYHLNPTKWLRYRQQSFVMPKPDGTLRIFCLGGSSVWGMSGAGPPLRVEETIPAKLQAGLMKLYPDRQIEVFSIAAPGLNSTQLACRLPELLTYAPDIFVFYTGHNEWSGGRWDAAYLDPSLVTRVRLALSPWRVMMFAESLSVQLRWVQRRWSGRNPRPQVFPAPPGGPPSEGEFVAAYQRFRDNLSSMVRQARDAGIDVVLCTVSSNLTSPPRQPSIGPDGHSPEPGPARQSYEEGVRLMRAGRFDEARAALDVAREDDWVPLRARREVNRIIRDVAGTEGAALANAEDAIRRAAPHGIPGNRFFGDALHPTPRCNQIIVQSIVEAITSGGQLGR
ncbi:MAG: SGNH/GDSL hydrolase family protein [Pseudomonadota bacterium]